MSNVFAGFEKLKDCLEKHDVKSEIEETYSNCVEKC